MKIINFKNNHRIFNTLFSCLRVLSQINIILLINIKDIYTKESVNINIKINIIKSGNLIPITSNNSRISDRSNKEYNKVNNNKDNSIISSSNKVKKVKLISSINNKTNKKNGFKDNNISK